MNGAISVSLAGIQSSIRAQAQSGQRVSNMGAHSETDLAKEMVAQIKSGHDLGANAAVVRAADERLGTVVDLLV